MLMNKTIFMFFGFSALIIWLQLCESVWVMRDAALLNGSFIVGATFIVVMLTFALLNRLSSLELSRSLILCGSAVACVLGLATSLPVVSTALDSMVRLLLFCVVVGLCALLMTAWGRLLSYGTYFQLTPLVFSSCLFASAVSAFAALTPAVACVVAAFMPLVSGGCLFASTERNYDDYIVPSPLVLKDRATNTAGNERYAFEPVTMRTLRDVSWQLPALLCACVLFASFFGGMTANPYMANSAYAVRTMGISGTALIAVMGVVSWVYLKRRCAASSEPEGDLHRESSAMLHICTATGIVVVIIGLLLFSTRLPGTMTTALGLVYGARNSLIAVIWLALPRFVADSRLPFAPCLALMLLASGMLYAHCFGIWFTRTAELGFDQLTTASTVVIALMAIVLVAYMAQRIHTLGTGEMSADAAVAAASAASDSNASQDGNASQDEAHAFSSAEGEGVAAEAGAATATATGTGADASAADPSLASDGSASASHEAPTGRETCAEPASAPSAPASSSADDAPDKASEKASSADEEAPRTGLESASIDEIRAALREQQIKMLEPYGLTSREVEVIRLVLDGMTFKNIAETLYITESTVKFHTRNAYDKMGVHSKKELLKMVSEK